ncbi:aldolase/citrate lyase family protein [soil metagenome]|jgi:citrate lyase subunit beta/citryl-CoA lyase
MIEKAQSLPADEVFLDLEDAVAPDVKETARRTAATALIEGDWRGKTRVVRINDATTAWAYRDVVEIVEKAGVHLDCLLLPKVTAPAHVQWLDLLLGQVERATGLEFGRIGIEAQIEDAAGLLHVEAIAAASPRLEALVFGPADFMASLAMPSLAVGGLHPDYPGDSYHYALVRIIVAARAHGLQAVDGPWLAVRDVDGFRAAARRSRALGYDGKWVVHPGQLDAANETYAPTQEEYDNAERILDAYAHALSAAGGRRGAVLLGAEMVDEASRKMALVIAARGRAAGLRRTPQD